MQNLSENQKQNSPMYISFCTQKGGAGKSVFTTLAASWLHYELGFSVAVIDCDYPQWSIHKLREREKEQITKNGFYKKKAYELCKKIGKRTYPVVPVQPETALTKANEFLATEEINYDLVLFDLPGTVNNKSVVELFFNMDYLFVPITTSRINMESTLNFIVTVSDIIRKNPQIRLKQVQTFWNRMTGRERQELYVAYENAMHELNIPIMQTRIPQSVRYDREQSISGNDYLFLSTVFPPDKPLLKGSNWDLFMNEFLKLTNLQYNGNHSH
ncbi:conjugal transfer protein TraA [Bacteroidia bacterium]|nr:conjugal transfer protein TraA [Bacteroidia bacterium]